MLEQHLTCHQPIQPCPLAPNLCLHVPLSSTSRSAAAAKFINQSNERASEQYPCDFFRPSSIVDDISVNNSANLKAIITPSIVAVIAENTQTEQTNPSDSDPDPK